MARRVLKILHLLGASGMTGALVVHVVLLATAPPLESLASYADLRRSIDFVTGWLLVPSLGSPW